MGTNISFTGIFSGLQTDTLIEALVGLRRTPIRQLELLAEGRDFEKEAYRLTSTRILSLKTSLLNLRLESTFRTKIASSSNSSILGVTAGFNAQPATHSVTIQSVAMGAKAISGLNDRSLERASVKMAYGNTAGITTIAMTSNNLGGTRALSGTLIHDTQQAGVGSTRITSGDRIKIDVTLKDTSTNTAYFTFGDDATDTVERLRQTIQAAFQGEAQVTIDRNGAFLITETDTSGVDTISLDTLTFEDTDYSGSTLTFTTGNTTAGNTATYRTIIGTRTFTKASSATIAVGTDLLVDLDQFSGSLSGDETIEISGTQYDGDSYSSSFAITGATTLNDLITELTSLVNDAPNPPWETVVTLEQGKLVFRDQSSGTSQTLTSMYFDDPGDVASLSMGTFVITDPGIDDISQTIRTGGFTVAATGKHIVTGTEGRGGVVTGTVSLDRDTILSSLGVTKASLFTIDRDNGAGVVDPVTIFGVTSRSTVQDLIDAINAQAPGVTAQLVDDGAGAYNLQIIANEGGRDFRLLDDTGGNGILENVLDPDTLSLDTDISTLSDSGLSSVDSATSVDTDYTFTTVFTPTNGGPEQRRTVVGTDGTEITDLITSVRLDGYAGAFNDGVALLYTDQSSELVVGPPTSQYLMGISGVSDAANTSTPALNIYTLIDDSGLDVALISGTFTINGVEITIDNTDSQTLDEIMGLVNSSGAGVNMKYDPVFDRFLIYRPDAGTASVISIGAAGDTSNFFQVLGLQGAGGAVQFSGTDKDDLRQASSLTYSGATIPVVSGTFTINGVKITVNAAADSLDDIIQRINDAHVGVIASYDSNSDRLILTQDLEEPPFFDQIQIGSATDTSNFWSSMRYTESYQQPQSIGTSRVKAEFTVDGQSYIRDTNEVDDVLNDITFNIKGVSSDPIAVDITLDTSKTLAVIAEFVQNYNELQEVLSIGPLDEDERGFLIPLTDRQRSELTFSEIDEYEEAREDFSIQNILNRSSTIQRLDSSLRFNLITPVTSVADDAIKMLSDIGIDTGNVGYGIELARTPYLVVDSVDYDTIYAKLESNRTLQAALEDKTEEVLDLFSNDMRSYATLIGNIDISNGISLAAPMRFSIGNGVTSAVIEFGVGYHTSSSIRTDIANALSQVGLGGEILVSQTDGGFLEITTQTQTGRARISIQDLGGGENIANKLGIASQTTIGDEAIKNAGLARRLDAFLDGYTGTEGILKSKIKAGGLIDQELLRIGRRIDDYEYRLALYELRLRREFTQMEIALASFEQTRMFLSAQMSMLTTGTSSGGISASF